MHLIRKYFPAITDEQSERLRILAESLSDWNEKINVVSRKDISYLEERHILHSLSIARFIQFMPGTKIIDVGTGGGFPGLPLAIMFPECNFTLIDSIAKKIKVVNEIVTATGIENTKAIQVRAETMNETFDFVVSRAVTALPAFYAWTKKLISKQSFNEVPNGIIYLKGGDFSQEISGFGAKVKVHPLHQWFDESWFEEKSIVYLPT